MKSIEKKTAIAGGVLSVMLVGGGLAVFSGGGSDPAPAAAAPSAPAPAAPASSGDGVSASGTVRSSRVRDLGFTTGGVVTALKVKVGSKVAKGDLLGTVDPTTAEENLDAAYSAYVAAQKSYKEVKEGGSTTASTAQSGTEDTKGTGQNGQGGAVRTVARAYALMVEARNAYTKAQREVAGTKIHAPFAGMVTALSVTVDQEVRSGGTALTLTDTASLRVGAEFSEADTARLKKGQKASVTFDSLGKTISGRVLSVSPVPVGSTESSAGPGGGFQASSTSVVRYEVLVSLSEIPSGTRVGSPVTVEVKAG
ncbi:HlyD family secretion protein [Actinocorallia populi]|uniref:HlyD family secretion protein n=1 Tax=Actinocorallia populi TaxID=2079200 RepID=UPI000D096D22|nr:HlyD family efflux transporter periplasmic adaptor subunit [Actinocorallia populi]